MFRQTRQLATRHFSHTTAVICDSPWFRLTVVVVLTFLLLPLPRVQACEIDRLEQQKSPENFAVPRALCFSAKFYF
jgi:hypothetical protein